MVYNIETNYGESITKEFTLNIISKEEEQKEEPKEEKEEISDSSGSSSHEETSSDNNDKEKGCKGEAANLIVTLIALTYLLINKKRI